MVFDVLLPLLPVLALGTLVHAANAPREYLGFLALGGAMAALWLNVLWGTALQLFWEKESGNLAYYPMSPAPRLAVLLGIALGGLGPAVVRAAAIFVVATLALGASYQVEQPLLVAAVFGATLVAVYALGALLASLYLLWTREAWHVNQLLQEPLYLVTGLYVPVRYLGLGVAAVALLVPLTPGLDAQRQLLVPGGHAHGLLPVGVELGILLAEALLFLFASPRALHRLEERGRRDGQLIVRGR